MTIDTKAMEAKIGRALEAVHRAENALMDANAGLAAAWLVLDEIRHDYRIPADVVERAAEAALEPREFSVRVDETTEPGQ